MLILGIVPVKQALTTYANWPILVFIVSLFIISTLFQKTGIISYIVKCNSAEIPHASLNVNYLLSLLGAVISALADSLMAVVVIVPFIIMASRKLRLMPAPFLISLLLSVILAGQQRLWEISPSRMISASGRITAGQHVLSTRSSDLSIASCGLSHHVVDLSETFSCS